MGRQLRTIFWGSQADEYEHNIVKRIVRFRRLRITAVNPAYVNPNLNLMAIEFSIQKYTKIEILGIYNARSELSLDTYLSVKMVDIYSVEGAVGE